MAFIPPIPLIRKTRIIKCLTKANAFSKETAKYLDEIGLVNPYYFKRITAKLVKDKTICKTQEGKYYINR